MIHLILCNKLFMGTCFLSHAKVHSGNWQMVRPSTELPSSGEKEVNDIIVM